GNVDEIADGEVQWMCAGSGIMHEEAVPAAERLLGVQLWLNLPAAEKMSKPTYRSIKNDEIREIGFEGGFLRLLTGSFDGVQGVTGGHLPLDYYDIHLNEGSTFSLEVDPDSSIVVFTLLGSVAMSERIAEPRRSSRRFGGDLCRGQARQVLFMRSRALGEPVAWGGPT
ncbi:MAG: pirin family protein, partial [Eggerthellaceae bacterium]